MADAFLSFAVQKLGDFLIQEVSLRTSLRDEVRWLRNELLFIQSFLKDAEQKQSRDQRVQQWVFEINSIANDDGLASRLKACACICRKEKKSYNDVKEIQSLKERIMDISRKRETYECKYLVVVDDVWQREAWESLKRAFPDSRNGSRVIITTRKEDVAERADDRGFVYKLRFLNQKESWELFCRKLVDVRAMVPEMERLARDMVEKCGGLPLAIAVLSGLLSHKRGLDGWQKVKDHLWKNIIKDRSIEISNILSLSYDDLSNTLKQCFLYFGIFPEDQVVHAEKIIWLWMAEGFIPNEEERMEDVAEGFLDELIRRSLVQVDGTLWEKVTLCRVHDLVRDLAAQKALEVSFFDIYDPRKHSISSLCIRHAIYSRGERYLSLDLSNLKLRSIMFFDPYVCNTINFGRVFQHLYVLYLDSEVVFKLNGTGTLPDAIGSLYHLKLLSLIGIQELPSSIGNLKNLQTLVVTNIGFSCQLPPETADLINLRHLDVPYSKPLKGISNLTSLQLLRGIHCDQWKDVNPVDLVNLGELFMDDITKCYSLNNISSLKNLNTLALSCEGNESFPSLEFLNSCEKLQKLWLANGRIEKVPLLFPNSITMMNLWDTKLMEDPMPILGMLPNLRYLELVEAYEGKEITCSDNSFSQLEFLRLRRLRNLERWHLGTSAMPVIKGLDTEYCPELKEIPERMKDVELLKR